MGSCARSASSPCLIDMPLLLYAFRVLNTKYAYAECVVKPRRLSSPNGKRRDGPATVGAFEPEGDRPAPVAGRSEAGARDVDHCGDLCHAVRRLADPQAAKAALPWRGAEPTGV